MWDGAADLDFAIIGAQKSASTYVHECLVQHPSIDIPPAEVRFFEDPSYSSASQAGFEQLFGPRSADVRRGLKRPDHLADPLAPGRITAAAPDVRVVAVLRDPVPRAMSAYVHYVRLGFLPLLPINDAFEGILDGSMSLNGHPRAADVLDYGLYGEHLSRWLLRVRRDRVHVMLQPDLASGPAAEIARLLTFLDLDPTTSPALAGAVRSANTGTYDHRRIRLLRSRNRFLFDYSTDLYRREPRRPSPLGLAWAATATAIDRGVLARRDRTRQPVLRSDLRARLRDYYREDTEALEALIGPVPWHVTND
ncbi:conserved hypothetical protein [Nocardioides sp. AX2bis]|nr:conserved hypothetical protein [Nocardioides sp. AX2bis]